MSGAARFSKQFQAVCKKCGEKTVISLDSEGLHAFICPYCGQSHLLIVDANLGVRDFRSVSTVPVRRVFDMAKIRIKDENLVPAHLKPYVDALKRGIIVPEVDALLRILEELDLLEVEG
uniref:Uncharacterized protein n=1 Tax=Thermofilum pendens TaxID=2269 RepID=A0A7C3SMI2_THEPE